MKIKTRESLRTIKTFDRAENLAQKSKSGISGLNRSSEETQSSPYESETEYAGNQVQESEEAGFRYGLYASDRIGRWGVKETKKNIRRWRDRPKKLNVKQTKQLTPPKHKAFSPATKNTVKTAKNSAKAAQKTAKASAKAAQKAAQAAKAAAKTTVKAVKIAIKATVAAVKAIIAGVKALVAAIAAGGWVAVVIIVVICAVALIIGSVFAIFIPNDKSSGITLQSTMFEADNEYNQAVTELQSKEIYDRCVFDGEKSDWISVIAVYAVKTNLDPVNPQEIATFNEEKARKLKSIYWDMNMLSSYIEVRNENEEHSEIQSDGSVRTVITEVNTTYLHIVTESLTAEEAAELYRFSSMQLNQFNELLYGNYSDIWNQLIH